MELFQCSKFTILVFAGCPKDLVYSLHIYINFSLSLLRVLIHIPCLQALLFYPLHTVFYSWNFPLSFKFDLLKFSFLGFQFDFSQVFLSYYWILYFIHLFVFFCNCFRILCLLWFLCSYLPFFWFLHWHSSKVLSLVGTLLVDWWFLDETLFVFLCCLCFCVRSVVYLKN